MNATQLIELRCRIPFQPFEIRLSDGKIVRVTDPWRIATGSASPGCAVYDDDGLPLIAYRNVTELVTDCRDAGKD